MFIKGMLKKDTYSDSMVLMSLSTKVNKLDDVRQAMIGMGTPLNRQIISEVGLETPEIADATPRDMIFVVQCDTEEQCDWALEHAWSLRNEIGKGEEDEGSRYRSTASAAQDSSDSALILISVPGEYAAEEARKAIEAGKNVMIFSDNVSVEDEVQLKRMAHEKGLLVMGPDCGTAIINGSVLCFGNVVQSGSIGIVAASGTGSQEISVQIDAMGAGVSQLIGVGGRDLSSDVGGIMMLDGMGMLAEDPDTSVIVLLSKPPAPEVAKRILEQAHRAEKPVVACFIGSDEDGQDGNVHTCSNTYEAARIASSLALGREVERVVSTHPSDDVHYSDRQEYVCGLFCGGTVCSEVAHQFKKEFGHVARNGSCNIHDLSSMTDHTMIDLGDDEFTKGRPHPMIDPSIRNSAIVQAAQAGTIAALVLDFELGYGSNDDPVGAACEAINEAKDIARKRGDDFRIIAYVLGTDKDPQNKAEQESKLVDLGVELCSSVADLADRAVALVPRHR